MSCSAIGGSSSALQQAQAAMAQKQKIGSDSDGDNDGSTGSKGVTPQTTATSGPVGTIINTTA